MIDTNYQSHVIMFEEFFKFKKKENNREENTILYDFLWALGLYLIISTFFYQNFVIPSGSMKPTLLEGDYIVVSKFKYGYSRYSLPFNLPLIKGRIFDGNRLKRGDVVVFAFPENTRIKYIKRLIGLPGDEVQIKDKILYVNGVEIEREENGIFIDPIDGAKLVQYRENLGTKSVDIVQKIDNVDYFNVNNTKVYKVPKGRYFFMGDNRENSRDSRFDDVGMVPYENIIGKAKIIFFSKNDETILKFWKWHKIIRFKRIFMEIK
jgi:signal peptidase I